MTDQSNEHKIGTLRLIRNRVIAGLFVVLPLFITFGVINWMYVTLYSLVLQPIAFFLKYAWKLEKEEPTWVEFMLSFAAFGLVLAVLFVAGMFFRSRLHHTVEWTLLNVPGVKTVYSAVSNVFKAISTSHDNQDKFKRVVLIEFPHSGMKAPAFVTNECKDVQTGQTILAVYVPTTPVPTSGYMLLVPQKNVVELNWDLEETLQAIVSGGITIPDNVTYHATPPLNISAAKT